MSKRGREREEADVKHAAIGGKTGESQSCRACCSCITLVCVAILKLEDTGLTALRERPERMIRSSLICCCFQVQTLI